MFFSVWRNDEEYGLFLHGFGGIEAEHVRHELHELSRIRQAEPTTGGGDFTEGNGGNEGKGNRDDCAVA